jgi:organic radical activating enzyme
MPDYNNNYHTMVRTVKDKINQVGPGFCLAKWYHVSMHLHTGQNHSCYHPHVHKTPLEEVKIDVSALHNTSWKKLQRKEMLEGGRPSECNYCWNIEDLPGDHISDRHLRSSEHWALPKLEETTKLHWDADVYPTYLELNFGHECQFKCSYCAPMASSSWFNETKKFGDWPLENHQNRGQYNIRNLSQPGNLYRKESENPYIEAFWRWFPDVYPHLKVLRFTGGEPLLSSNVFKVIDYIKDHPRADLEFAINSNMGIPKRNLNKFIEQIDNLQRENKIKNVTVFTSVDTWGAQAEWIRNGLDIVEYEDNLHHFMQNVYNPSFSFMITFCLLSIPNFNLLLDKILEFRRKYNTDGRQHITFDTPYMVEPPHLTALLADEWFIEKLNDHLDYMKSLVDDTDITKFNTTEYLKLKRVVEWVETNRYQGAELSINRRDFAKFVDEHDHRRETNWHTTFPELANFYKTCKESQ